MHRAARLLLGLGLAALGAFAASRALRIDALDRGGARPEAPPQDLVLTFPFARLERDTRAIEFGTPAAAAHHEEPDPREHERASGFLSLPSADAEARCAVAVGHSPALVFTRLQPAAGRVRLELTGLPAEAGVQRVRLHLNGGAEPLAEHELPAPPSLATIEAPLPAARLHAGENRLELRFERVLRRAFETSGPYRLPMAAVIRRASFEFDGDPAGARAADPLELGRDVLAGEDGAAEPSLVFPEGARLCLPARLPAGRPAFRARLLLHPDERAAGPLPVVVRLVADPLGGMLLFQGDLAAGGDDGAAIDADLSLFAGQVVSIQIESRSKAADRPPARLCLAAPRIEGGLLDEAAQGGPPDAAARRAEALQRLRGANVVLFTLDAAAARHFTAYGAAVEDAPAVDGLARDGATFESTVAPASYTLASIASLFSGRWPAVHGVLDVRHALAPGAPTLASALRDAGYATVGVVTNPNAGAAYGLGHGFERYDELNRDPALWDEGVLPEAVAARVAEHVAAGRLREPFFLYVHLFQPHAPYTPPAEFAAPLLDPRYEGPADGTRAGIDAYRSHADDAWSAGDFDALERRYRANVRHADSGVARVLEALESGGLLARTVVAAVGDHGESFGRHGSIEHGDTTYADEVEVPFVLRAPEGALAPCRVRGPNSLVDVAPTLLSLVGAPVPATFDGLDRTPGLFDAPAPDRAVFTRSLGSRPRVALRRGGFSYHADLYTRAERLFDVAADPHETRDVRASRPALAERLREELARHLGASRPAGAAATESDEQARQIGYVSPGADAALPAGALHRR